MIDHNGGPFKKPRYPRLHVVPLELREANDFVDRHHPPVQGHRFSIGAVTDIGKLVGVATVGRPVARFAGSPKEILEVTRLCTDGTPNVCSFLYNAAARVGKALGYKRIQTYILDWEPGTSLKAAGWINEGKAGGGIWTRPGQPQREPRFPTGPKQRWARMLNTDLKGGIASHTDDAKAA